MEQWFLKIAPGLEHLTLTALPPTAEVIPRILTMAADAAPRLRLLAVDLLELDSTFVWVGAEVMQSLELLGQIRELSISGWVFPPCGDVTALQCLSGLRTLEVCFLTVGAAKLSQTFKSHLLHGILILVGFRVGVQCSKAHMHMQCSKIVRKWVTCDNTY